MPDSQIDFEKQSNNVASIDDHRYNANVTSDKESLRLLETVH